MHDGADPASLDALKWLFWRIKLGLYTACQKPLISFITDWLLQIKLYTGIVFGMEGCTMIGKMVQIMKVVYAFVREKLVNHEREHIDHA